MVFPADASGKAFLLLNMLIKLQKHVWDSDF